MSLLPYNELLVELQTTALNADLSAGDRLQRIVARIDAWHKERDDEVKEVVAAIRRRMHQLMADHAGDPLLMDPAKLIIERDPADANKILVTTHPVWPSHGQAGSLEQGEPE